MALTNFNAEGAEAERLLAAGRQRKRRTRRIEGQWHRLASLCHRRFCFAWVVDYGFLMGPLAESSSMAVLGFVAAAATTVLGRQKSIATLATSSGGLLMSGLKR
jgi:hypothetical protein